MLINTYIYIYIFLLDSLDLYGFSAFSIYLFHSLTLFMYFLSNLFCLYFCLFLSLFLLFLIASCTFSSIVYDTYTIPEHTCFHSEIRILLIILSSTLFFLFISDHTPVPSSEIYLRYCKKGAWRRYFHFSKKKIQDASFLPHRNFELADFTIHDHRASSPSHHLSPLLSISLLFFLQTTLASNSQKEARLDAYTCIIFLSLSRGRDAQGKT